MTTTKILARLAAAGTTAAALIALVPGAPAQAATPTSGRSVTLTVAASETRHFRIVFGASVAEGDVTKTDRSFIISGSIKAVSASRTASFEAWDLAGNCYMYETRTASAGTTRTFGFDRKCDFRGGWYNLEIYFPV